MSDRGPQSQRPIHVRFAPKADKQTIVSACPLCADCVAKVFLAFGRETLIQDRARTSNNDSKEPTLRSDCYKFLFHRASSATFATQSAISGCEQMQQWRLRKPKLFDHQGRLNCTAPNAMVTAACVGSITGIPRAASSGRR